MEGLQALCEMLKTNVNLQHINMNLNEIGPRGAESLAAGLMENKGLQSLRPQAHPMCSLFCTKASAPIDTLTDCISVTSHKDQRVAKRRLSH